MENNSGTQIEEEVERMETEELNPIDTDGIIYDDSIRTSFIGTEERAAGKIFVRDLIPSCLLQKVDSTRVQALVSGYISKKGRDSVVFVNGQHRCCAYNELIDLQEMVKCTIVRFQPKRRVFFHFWSVWWSEDTELTFSRGFSDSETMVTVLIIEVDEDNFKQGIELSQEAMENETMRSFSSNYET